MLPFASIKIEIVQNAVVGRALKVVMTRNSMLLSERMDNIELSTAHAQPGELYGIIQVQSLLESMKEIYGWLLFVAILCLTVLMLRYCGIRPMKVIEPTYRTIYNILRGNIKLRLRLRRRNRVLQH